MDPRFERGFVRSVVSLLCLVAAVHGLFQFGELRGFLKQPLRLEGDPSQRVMAGLEGRTGTQPTQGADCGQVSDGEGTLKIRPLAEPKGEIWVLINGRSARLLAEGDGPIACRDGDLIEVLWPMGEGSVIVSEASPNLVSPAVGTLAEGSGILLIGRVRIK